VFRVEKALKIFLKGSKKHIFAGKIASDLLFVGLSLQSPVFQHIFLAQISAGGVKKKSQFLKDGEIELQHLGGHRNVIDTPQVCFIFQNIMLCFGTRSP